jgi:hypothetical protein
MSTLTIVLYLTGKNSCVLPMQSYPATTEILLR